jgi:hypothetical protein
LILRDFADILQVYFRKKLTGNIRRKDGTFVISEEESKAKRQAEVDQPCP